MAASGNLFEALAEVAAARSGHPLLELGDGSIHTYGAMLARTAQLAHALRDQGVGPGDRVAVQVEKSHEALYLYLACLRAGAVFLPLNTAYTYRELDYFFGDAEPALIVCDPAGRNVIAEGHKVPVLGLDARGAGELADIADTAASEFETVARAPEDLAALIYTSGTTGRAKGAMLSHRAILSNARTLVDYWGFTAADVLLHMLPIYHVHGLFVASNTLMLAGGQMIFLPKFDAGEACRLLPRVTSMMGVPTYYTRLLAAAAFTGPGVSGEVARGRRLFISGSAPLLPETFQAFEKITGHRILERYGMTECGMNTSNPLKGPRKAGTVGLPLPGIEVRIGDADGKILPPGEPGMVEVRGPNLFSGYWRLPEKTAEEFRADGFFITGDIGRFDEDGYLEIVGREKDLIISGGLNIYPKEIETVIDAIDGVGESAVIGVPHPDFGEAVVAVIARSGEIDEARVRNELRDQLAGFKQPKALCLVDELPRNAMGKVQKSRLRETCANLFSNEVV